MIKANELRSGNRLLYGGKEITIDIQILYSLFVDGILLPEKLEPIPLTIEWLERCGFKDGWLTFKDGSQLVVHKDGTATIGGWDSATSSQSVEVPCAYLHQLQNLYFALTGEELNVKL